jgi:hypothetical protein
MASILLDIVLSGTHATIPSKEEQAMPKGYEKPNRKNKPKMSIKDKKKKKKEKQLARQQKQMQV